MIKKEFYEIFDGKEIYKFTLGEKIKVEILNYGCYKYSLKVPDRNGELVDVCFGYDGVKNIFPEGDYLGGVAGRCCNRIKKGEFTLNGVNYKLNCNNGENHLHGGNIGINQRVWDYEIKGDSLYLSYFSPDGEENYPGNLNITVKYTVVDTSLIVEFFGKTDKDTLYNPTDHLCFNLNGEGDSTILDHYLKINADYFTPIDDTLITTGEIKEVKGTPFDFREYKQIGKDLSACDKQLKNAGGYDHNFCVNGKGFREFASVYSEKTGIKMQGFTDRCGVHFYGGNFINNQKGKHLYTYRSGFCLETQVYPDAINKPNWQTPILRAGEDFYSKTEFKFTVKND